MSAYLRNSTGVTLMNESKNDHKSNFAKFNGNAEKLKPQTEKPNEDDNIPKPDVEKPKNDNNKPK